MKTALVTGANKGIGFEIARQLGQLGYHIFLSARNESRGIQATQSLQNEGIQAEFILMDVSSLDSIQSAAELVRKKTDHLDVLINNAAILLKDDKNILTVSDATLTATLNTNVRSILHVTRTFGPLLTTGSRVVNISSDGGAISQGAATWAPLYCVSKTAVNAITMQFSAAFADKGVLVNAVSPGWVRTDMGGTSASRSVEKGAETPVWVATDPSFSDSGKFFRDKAEIAW